MSYRVLHVYKAFFPETTGGIEHSIHDMCKGMEGYGVESKVLCVGKTITGRTSFNGIDVYKYPYNVSISSCPVSTKLLKNFRKESEWADIIHFHYPWPFGDLLSFVSPKSKKKLVTYHSDIIKQKLLKLIYRPLEKAFLSKMQKIIVTSPNYIKISKNLKEFKDKVQTIPLSIDESNYPKPNIEKSLGIRKKFGDQFILFVGQLRYYKGLHLLIQAVKDLNTNLVIIGGGKEESNLKNLCRSLNIKNVFFLGRLSESDKVNYLHACYCLALPSHLKSEAFGVSLLEGGMFAKPLLSCKIGTGSEYINDHLNTGLVVEPTPRALYKALKYLLDNPEIARKMGYNARARVNYMFTPKVTHCKLHDMYSNLLSSI